MVMKRSNKSITHLNQSNFVVNVCLYGMSNQLGTERHQSRENLNNFLDIYLQSQNNHIVVLNVDFFQRTISETS